MFKRFAMVMGAAENYALTGALLGTIIVKTICIYGKVLLKRRA